VCCWYSSVANLTEVWSSLALGSDWLTHILAVLTREESVLISTEPLVYEAFTSLTVVVEEVSGVFSLTNPDIFGSGAHAPEVALVLLFEIVPVSVASTVGKLFTFSGLVVIIVTGNLLCTIASH